MLVGGHRSIAPAGHLGEGVTRRDPAMVGDLARIGDDLRARGQAGDEEPRVVAPRAPGWRDPSRQRQERLDRQPDADLLRQLPDRRGDVRVVARLPVRRIDRAAGEDVQPGPERHRRRAAGQQHLEPTGSRPDEDDRRRGPRDHRARTGLRLRQGAPRAPRARSPAGGTRSRGTRTRSGRPSSANRPASRGTDDTVGRRRRGLDAERVEATIEHGDERPGRVIVGLADDRHLRRPGVRDLQRAQPLRERRRVPVQVGTDRRRAHARPRSGSAPRRSAPRAAAGRSSAIDPPDGVALSWTSRGRTTSRSPSSGVS